MFVLKRMFVCVCVSDCGCVCVHVRVLVCVLKNLWMMGLCGHKFSKVAQKQLRMNRGFENRLCFFCSCHRNFWPLLESNTKTNAVILYPHILTYSADLTIVVLWHFKLAKTDCFVFNHIKLD